MVRHLLSLLILACLLTLLSACRPQVTGGVIAPSTPESTSTIRQEVAIATPTVPPSPPTAGPPSATPLPPPSSPTPRPTEAVPSPTIKTTILSSPSATPPASPSPTVTPTPSRVAVRIGEPCPAVAPIRPDYSPYFLSPQPWPRPDEAARTTHFWLSKPLPGSGRLLINQGFPYGWDGGGRYLLHNGVDTAEELGTPVLAAADGTVVVARADESELFGWRCDWYGQLVVIELDEQWQGQPVYALYGHVLNIIVQEGERVIRGQPLAEVGIGGVATVPHLHFEVRVGENRFGSTRNPMLWIIPAESRGVIAGWIVDPEGRPWQGVTLTLIDNSGQQGLINTWSYLDDPQHLINPDEGLAENFVFADVPPGEYDVYTRLQSVEYRVPVTLLPGEVASVEIVTEPYKTPTPTSAAAESPTPSTTPESLPPPTIVVTDTPSESPSPTPGG